MQTFLPYASFEDTAKVLDYRRLGKQRVEAFQIVNTLRGFSQGWQDHPAVKMWKNHERSLHLYINAMIMEAKLRGIKTDTNENNIRALFDSFGHTWGEGMPDWYFDENKIMRVVTTHKANLFNKDPLYYSAFQIATTSPYNKPCCDKCKYFWVTHTNKEEVNG